MKGCPRTWGLSILSRKWSYFILRALKQPRTFTELQKELRFVTNHILSRELKLLQAETLMTATDGKYALSASGSALLSAVEPLHQWGFTHMKLQPCPPEKACSQCYQYTLEMKPKLQVSSKILKH
jgi:DNA-binding HxlR family transcriptional regulator